MLIHVIKTRLVHGVLWAHTRIGTRGRGCNVFNRIREGFNSKAPSHACMDRRIGWSIDLFHTPVQRLIKTKQISRLKHGLSDALGHQGAITGIHRRLIRSQIDVVFDGIFTCCPT